MNEFTERTGDRPTTADIAARTNPAPAQPVGGPAGVPKGDAMTALFPTDERDHLKSHWMEIQSEFVDEPRKSIEEADGLVATTIQRLAESFADARSKLEQQWSRGGDVSTEDLRVLLQRYRSFFDRLLAV